MSRIVPALLTISVLASQLLAATSAKVQTLDEGLTETNISKPRIYIENTGTTTLTDFVYYYYFTVENGKTPVLEDYYTPEAAISLEQVNVDLYRVKYTVTGASLTPGQLLPNSSGNVIGLHYNDWSTWNKANDYSNSQTSSFIENTKIPVYSGGSLINGTEPSGSGGAITREVWTSIYGTSVSAIPVTTPFNSTGTLALLEEPVNWNDNFGTRLRGYITAPSTGTYYFWIAGDDNCELRLSSDDRSEHKSAIASVPDWTNYRQWDKFPSSQKSTAITLTAGQRYYIEVLHKEGGGGDNLSVGWAKPGQSTTAPSEVIPGSVLTPFVAPNATPTLSATLASPTQINLSWSDACTNEDGFRIERSVSGGSYSQVADLGTNTTSFQNTGLAANTVYAYRVRAYNSQGYSAYSNIFTLTTQESTAGVVVREVWTNLAANGEISSIPLTTTPNVTTTINLLQEPSNVADNFGTRIRGYITAPSTGSYTFWICGDDAAEFWLSTTSSSSNKNKIAYTNTWVNPNDWNVNASQKSAVISLTAGAKYFFEILHKEATGGDNMAVGWIKPGQSGTVPSEIIPGSVLSKFVAPVAPSNLMATATSGTSINLAWSDYSDNEENFIIEQSLDGVNFTQIATKTANTTNHAVTGLLPSTTYSFRVKTVNSAGYSAWSSVASTATQYTTAGAITREVWLGIPTNNGVNGIPVSTTPNSTGSISLLQGPANVGDAFGARVRGYLTPATTGAYTFWISGDDDCKLFLSTDDNPANKSTVAEFIYWTDPLQWTKFASQKSNPVNLVAGKRYYIEVLHFEISGNDHMAVGWAKPGESTTAPSEIIPGSVLSMFVAPVAPTNLAASTISSTQIDLSWNDNSDNETGFIIEQALAGQSFAQAGTVGAGITTYASTGLTPNSQYQFRIRAINYAGQSAYTATATAITGAPGDQEGPELTPQLLSFAIYSQDLSTVKDRSMFSGGGAVGSNTLVNIELDAKIFGNVVSGGNVFIKDRSQVQGDVTCGGTLTKVESATISGTVTESAAVTTVEIPEQSALAYGTTDISANSGQNLSLTPGSYRNCTINPGATITFTPGSYTFKSFTIGNDAFAVFNVPMDKVIEINVETSLDFQDRATAKFLDKGYAPTVKFYTNAYNIRIGTDVKLTGILTAPHADVAINSRTRVEGAIYAKSISLEPDAVFVSACVDPNADADGDGIPNLTEMVISDEPDDSANYTLMGVPTPAMIDNTADQTVTYDFGLKYPFFPNSRAVPMTYTAGSLVNASVAPAFTMSNKPPAGIPEFEKEGYSPVGNYMSMIANSLAPGASLQAALPVFSGMQPAVSYNIAWYHTDASQWEVKSATLEDGYVLDDPITDASAMIIVVGASGSENGMRTTAYLDNGMIYATEAKAKLRFDGRLDVSGVSPSGGDLGTATITYLEHTLANPAGVQGTLNCDFVDYRGYQLIVTKNADFSNKITIKTVTISSPAYSISYNYPKDFVVKTGQTLSLYIDKTIGDINNSQYKGDRISALYDANSIIFESMAFGEGVMKNNGGAWRYHYYLKDHLGTTRMVVQDDGALVEASMYQPYGKMVPVVDGNESVRERFTGKEFDREGSQTLERPTGRKAVFNIHISDISHLPDAGNSVAAVKAKLQFKSNHSTEVNAVNNGKFDQNNCPMFNFDRTEENIELGPIHYDLISITFTFAFSGGSSATVNYTANLAGPDYQVGDYENISFSINATEEAIKNSSLLAVLHTEKTSTQAVVTDGMGLSYFGARYYDPEVGSWTSTDPKNQSWNIYGYCGGNPLMNIDPNGESFFTWIDGVFKYFFTKPIVIPDAEAAVIKPFVLPVDNGGINIAFEPFTGPISLTKLVALKTFAVGAIMAEKFAAQSVDRTLMQVTENLASKSAINLADEAFVHVAPTRFAGKIASEGLDPSISGYVTKWKYVKGVSDPSTFNTILYRQNLWSQTAGKFDQGASILSINGAPKYLGPRTNWVNGIPQWRFNNFVQPENIQLMGTVYK